MFPQDCKLSIKCCWILAGFHFFLQLVCSCYVETTGGRFARLESGPVSAESEGQETDEKRLLRFLMRGYERDVRPVKNASHPIVIQLGITLAQIFDMDEKSQVLTTIVWLDQEWQDELLQWNPDDFNGMKRIRVPCERIWVPDIVLYNNADDYTRGYMNSRAMVHYDGNVFWPPPTKFRSICPIDVTYFPWDIQECKLKLGSWAYDGYQVDITNRTEAVDLSNYVHNGEWDLLDVQLVRNVVYYNCCVEPFPDVTVTLKIQRKTLYYVYNIVLPCMMMSALTLLVFCLPPESGEKVGLGVTVLLAFSVFMLAIAEKMPETSESIPLIGIYLTAVMAITSISVVMTVVVLTCHYKNAEAGEVPRWMKKCFLPRGASVKPPQLFVSRPNYEPPHCNGQSLMTTSFTLSQQSDDKSSGCCSSCQTHQLVASSSYQESKPISVLAPAGIYSEIMEANLPLHYGMRELTAEERKRSFARSSKKHRKEASPSRGRQTAPAAYENSVRIESQDGVKTERHSKATNTERGFGQDSLTTSVEDNLVEWLYNRHNQNQANQYIVQQWRHVARTVDRILFWIVCFITCSCSALFLFVIPAINRGWTWSRPF